MSDSIADKIPGVEKRRKEMTVDEKRDDLITYLKGKIKEAREQKMQIVPILIYIDEVEWITELTEKEARAETKQHEH